MNQCRVLVVIGVLISRHEQTINIKANPHQRLKNVKTVLRLTLKKNSDGNNQCNGFRGVWSALNFVLGNEKRPLRFSSY